MLSGCMLFIRMLFVQVEDWYQWYELTHPSELPIKRRIYLATDEPKVLKDAKEKYGENTF